jgi:hypothetical protein
MLKGGSAQVVAFKARARQLPKKMAGKSFSVTVRVVLSLYADGSRRLHPIQEIK